MTDPSEPSRDEAHGFVGGAGHRHLDAVVLPDETMVWAASFPRDGYEREQPPDWGLYLDARWRPPWPHRHVDWPDFGLPADPQALVDDLHDLLRRARGGERVEVGCLGGHGRTGTTLACLAVIAGLTDDPIHWVRSNYCEHAVETEDQIELVRRLHRYSNER